MSVIIDGDHLLPNGRQAVARLLRRSCGVGELVDEHITLAGEGARNSGAKALTVIGGPGRRGLHRRPRRAAGATPALLDGVRAPSTIGTWLRLLIWAAVRHTRRSYRQLLASAPGRPAPGRNNAALTIDVDSSAPERCMTVRGGRAHRRPSQRTAEAEGQVEPRLRCEQSPAVRTGLVSELLPARSTAAPA